VERPLADVPTVAETAGFKGFDAVAWTGLFAPAHTPPAIVERLNRELEAVLVFDEVHDKLAEQGAVSGSGSAAAFAAFVEHEQARPASCRRPTSKSEPRHRLRLGRLLRAGSPLFAHLGGPVGGL